MAVSLLAASAEESFDSWAVALVGAALLLMTSAETRRRIKNQASSTTSLRYRRAIVVID